MGEAIRRGTRAERAEQPKMNALPSFKSWSIGPAKLWRVRGVAGFEIDLAVGNYEHREAALKIGVIPQVFIKNNDRLIDIFIEGEENVPAAEMFVRGYNAINEFLDRVALTAYSFARLKYMVSACPANVMKGDTFEMATSSIVSCQAALSITPINMSLVKWTESESVEARIGRLLRQALNAQEIEERYLKLYSVLEQIAEKEAKDKIPNNCPKCKHVWNGGAATGNYIHTLISEAGGDASQGKAWRALRGKVAHGGGVRDLKFFNELTMAAGQIEGVCVGLAANRLGITVGRTRRAIVGFPLISHKCKIEHNLNPLVIESAYSVQALFSEVKLNLDDRTTSGCQFGYPTGPDLKAKISQLSWPSIN